MTASQGATPRGFTLPARNGIMAGLTKWSALRMTERFYRFAPTPGWLTHLWKSSTRQDHAHWRPALEGIIPKDGITIDVGAHGGQFSRLLAGLVPAGLVVAVEPSSYARSILRPALWARRTRNAVVVATALGSETGMALLRTPIKRRGDMGYGLANIVAIASPGVSEPVPVTTLDRLVATLGLARLDFIKADIEGHEAAMLAGARESLTRFRPALLMEHDAHHLARAGSSLDAIWRELVPQGYQPYRLSEGRLSRISTDQPQEGDLVWLAE